MTNETSGEASLHARIHSSPGMKVLNTLHARSFSLNIFQMNALELMEATRKVRDPDFGLPLMSEANREAGQQAHRELNRHIHNFVASAKSLVDHTRVFLNTSYAKSAILETIELKIGSSFSESPVIAFVHDLRNYMVHKGLPNSHMFLDWRQEPSTGSDPQVTSGIRFDTRSLTEWSKWTAPARIYMTGCGEYIDIHRFTEEYVAAVSHFHAWLELKLREHHSVELQEFQALQLQAAMQDSDLAHSKLASREVAALKNQDSKNTPEETIQEALSLSKSDAMAIDSMSTAWMAKVRKVTLPPQDKPTFPSQRPSVTLNADEAIGTPLLITQDIDGEPVYVFLRKDKELFGLVSDDWFASELMKDQLRSVPWIRERISRSFIGDVLVTWAQDRFTHPEGKTFSCTFLEKCRTDVTVVDIWVPVAHLEIEEALTFGAVKICPLSAEQIDEFEATVVSIHTGKRKDSEPFFSNIRTKFQGFAATLFTVEAEPVIAQERALVIARDAVSLLRFFAPAAPNSDVLYPVALAGLELVPSTNVITVSKGRFGYTSSMASSVSFWRLSSAAISNLQQSCLFLQAARLLDPSHLSEFAMAVRLSLITFSTGCTLADRIERLGYALSSLECVLLKHEMEPVQASVADRLALLVSDNRADYDQITQLVRHAYHLRMRHWAQAPSPRDLQVVMELVSCAHAALSTTLLNAAAFQTKAEFLYALLQPRDNLFASDNASVIG